MLFFDKKWTKSAKLDMSNLFVCFLYKTSHPSLKKCSEKRRYRNIKVFDKKELTKHSV